MTTKITPEGRKVRREQFVELAIFTISAVITFSAAAVICQNRLFLAWLYKWNEHRGIKDIIIYAWGVLVLAPLIVIVLCRCFYIRLRYRKPPSANEEFQGPS
jgi:hypothetical protein